MKLNFITSALCLLLLSSAAYSIQPEYLNPNGTFLEYELRLKQQKELERYKQKPISTPNIRNYDALKYDLELDWTVPLSSEPIKYEFDAVNNITALIKDDETSVLEFDAQNMGITKVEINGINSAASNLADNILSVELPEIANSGDTLQIKIAYKFIGSDTLGFYLYPKGLLVGYGASGESVYTEERIAYTMSEPNDARAWMPCNDVPSDKAIATISIKVPEGFTAVSNGMLKEIIGTEDNNLIFVWSDSLPVSTYLMAATASKFVSYSEWYKPNGAEGDSVELSYYVWESDLTNEKTDWTVYNAKNAFAPTMFMMENFVEKFGTYPFKKYGQVALQPFYFGGMEHQTITSINRSWLRGNQQAGIAHELAHQWLGDLVTCENWENVWFNEGGATWSEAIWAESWGQWDWYLKYMEAVAKQYFNRPILKEYPIYGISSNDAFSNPFVYLVYNKASWVFHQLRIMLGDDVFFPALQNLFKKFAFSNINISQFQEYFESEIANPPVPFNIFFKQWLEDPGHPIYLISASTQKIGEQYELTVDTKQVQEGNGIPDVFHTYLPIVAYNHENESVFFVVNEQREQEYKFQLDFLPDSVKIDTRMVLAEASMSEVIVSAADDKPLDFGVCPNVVQANDYINIHTSESGLIELYDLLGNRIDVINSGASQFNNTNFYKMPNLPAGQYFIKLTNQNGTSLKKIIVN